MQRGVSKNHALIVVEDLRIKNMSSSASGTKDAPGKNIKAKSGLNKSILDQGWGEFVRQLEYKQDWNGNLLVKIPAPNTSIRCMTRKLKPRCICTKISTSNEGIKLKKNSLCLVL